MWLMGTAHFLKTRVLADTKMRVRAAAREYLTEAAWSRWVVEQAVRAGPQSRSEIRTFDIVRGARAIFCACSSKFSLSMPSSIAAHRLAVADLAELLLIFEEAQTGRARSH
jgi:hypothetical protein